MKTQLNLLPDIKLQRVKQSRTRNLLVTIAVLVSAACAAIFVVMLLTVYGVQKKQLSNANSGITTYTNQLKNIDGLNGVLTIQNQLNTLVNLHQTKHISSRLFTDLGQITPNSVFIGHMNIDLAASTLTIDGSANSQHDINTFIDTLKFTTYKVGNLPAKNAFDSVVEDSFSLTDTGANYTVKLKFNPELFSNNLKDSQNQPAVPALTVPKQTTTRSVISTPSDLFNGQNSKGGQ